jgi:hypothetical protein
MEEFNRERALARYIELYEERNKEFLQLPDVERRVARGDYDFFSNADIELRDLEEEAKRNGFILEWTWDGHDIVYTIEQMSPEDHIAYLAEEQELMLEDLKWRYSEGLIDP